MSSFQIDTNADGVRLRLVGELTIEQARALHAALANALQPGHTLFVNAAGATRFDAAALQVLIAAARHVAQAVLTAPAPAWEAAFRRYALADPFTAPGNSVSS